MILSSDSRIPAGAPDGEKSKCSSSIDLYNTPQIAARKPGVDV